MLENEFKFFKENHDKLFHDFPNKYIVIKADKVIYGDDTFEKALNYTVKQHLEVGTFLIQLCSEGKDAYTQTFHSRVIFV